VPDSSLADLLDAVRREPKRPFHPGTSPDKVRKILDRVTSSGSGRRGLLRR
jgi:hypothetical protein